MEKAVVKKMKGKYMIRSSDVWCALFAIAVGYGSTILTPVLIFLYAAFTYLRSTREAYISVFFIMLFALEQDVLIAYFYALGFALFFVLLHAVKILNRNLFQWLPYVLGLVLIPYAVRQYGISAKAMIEPLMGMLLMLQMTLKTGWLQRCFHLPEAFYGILILSLALVMAQMLPLYYSQILLLGYLLIALICETKTTMTLLGALLLLPLHMEALLCVVLLCMVFGQNRLLLSGLLIVSTGFLPQEGFTWLYVALAIFCVLIARREYIPLLAIEEATTQPVIKMGKDNLLRRQMQNYAGIFQSLAEYYEGAHDMGSHMLLNMANALQYNAEEIQKVQMNGTHYDQLRKALEGYQFQVEHMQVDEGSDGCLHITLDIGNLRRGEIHTTLQPLLEALLHRKLQVLEIHKKRFVRGFSILLADALPFTIEAVGDSVKNAYTSSGDSYSIFRFRQSTICMISDGMGNGERAARSSRLITSIFQRMIVSGIPQDRAVRCINKLIQSDTFATLDAICVNRSTGIAYISKSAACPTFLLRDGQVHEINGNALPVGIISAIEPDCFQVELQEGDEFLMISDGISRQEVYHWLRTRENAGMKEDLAVFIDQLSMQRRKDDSTMLFMRVQKNSEDRS